MSLDNGQSLDQPVDFSNESQKKSRISYTREFLLTFSELDACKKLPSGFDHSLLGEFENTSQDRQRIPGPLSGYWRNEYGTSPPTRVDSANYPRGVHGRWDSRPSGRNETDSQSDRDSDTGRRYGNQSRWEGPEHDGLLGSGSFPRPSGFRAGASAPKFRANDNNLDRSNEPYHPPRPYKAVPHLRKQTNDSLNDETFGSTDCTDEDRAEDERKRRASFESWRKEQQKVSQDKKTIPERLKGDFDFSELLADSNDDKGFPNTSKEPEEPVPTSNIDFNKSSLPSQTPASRPLVPPGFAGSILERNFGTKTSKNIHSLQVGSSEIEGSLTDAKGILLNGTSDDILGKRSKQNIEETLSKQQFESTSIHILANSKSVKALNFSSGLDKPNEGIGVDSWLYKSSSVSKAFEAPGNTKVTEPDSKNLLADKLLTKTIQDGRSTSILDKLFGRALTPNEGVSTDFTEPNDSKGDETLAPDTSHSSKFAHLFFDEDKKKTIDNLSTGMPKDLLSLIQGGEKGVSHVSDRVATTHVTSNFPFQIPGLADEHVISNLTSHGIENSEKSFNINDVNKPTAVPAVLTCEDLEKSILTESIENDPMLPPAVEGWNVDAQTEKPRVNVDDHASHHLLSLLQNKTSMGSVKSSTSLEIRPSEKVQNIENETASVDSAPRDSVEANGGNASSSAKSLTLEALFGSAFMKELQSVGAPASVDKGSIESARVDVLESSSLPLHVTDNSVRPSTVHIGSNRTPFETNILPFTQRERIRSDGIEEQFLGYNDAQSVLGSSHLRGELGSKLGDFGRSTETQLPEEDTLIGVGNPGKLHNLMAGIVKAGLFPSQETPVNAAEKLAAFKGIFRDERDVGQQEGPTFLPGLYDMREQDIPFHNQNVQHSSPQLHPQLNHRGPSIHSLDSHPSNINSQVKFMAPEGIIHHDAAPNHQFPASMLHPPFHHLSSGPAGFEPSMHHPMLQQMPMPGNFPPPHLQRGFPYGHGQWQPQLNFAGPGMPPGHDAGGGHHPEALQRLMEMELRSKPKQVSPFGAAGHSHGNSKNHELDMGFGYR